MAKAGGRANDSGHYTVFAMGAIRMTAREFLDFAEEHIACSSGLLLVDHDLEKLSKRAEIDLFLGLLRIDGSAVIRIRAEEIEQAVISVRAAVGNLPNNKIGLFEVLDRVHPLAVELKADVPRILRTMSRLAQERPDKMIGEDVVNVCAQETGYSLSVVLKVALAYGELLNRSVFNMSEVKHPDWDGSVPLKSLFEGEHIPDDAETYLDQRFIDYLAAQGEDVNQMHWRNFERLTAEFFARKGYHVQLGPGQKDGGVDVRVWTDKKAGSGPPLVLVQCKRKKDSAVQIEWVKALWADVTIENAKGGLLATTTSVSPAGKRLAMARGWPLSFADGQQVRQWARTMWRHSFSTPESS